MANMKETWKKAGKGMGEAGKSIGFAFRDLGKAIVHSASVGAKKADVWANSDEEEAAKVETEKEETEE